MFLSTAIPLTVIFTSPVLARLNMAQCVPGFDWNRNSLGQDPCTVGSILGASCRGLTEYAYPHISSTEYYLPPMANHSVDLTCDCNSVVYSLYMACASCQGGEIYSWTKWIEQCASIDVSQYPANVPQGTAVPRWAYYNVTLLPDQTWNESVVINTGLYPREFLKQFGPSFSFPPATTEAPGKKTIFQDPTPLPNPVASPNTNPPEQPTPTPPPNPPAQQPTPNPTSNPQGPTQNPAPNPQEPATNSPQLPVPTDTANSPEPTNPTSDTNSAGPPISTGDNANLPQPTNDTSDPSVSRPANPTSHTGSSRPASPTNTTLPVATNATNIATKSGTNGWITAAVIFIWALA